MMAEAMEEEWSGEATAVAWVGETEAAWVEAMAGSMVAFWEGEMSEEG